MSSNQYLLKYTNFQSMGNNNKLSHINEEGLPSMVDVSEKSISARLATAKGRISIDKDVMQSLKDSAYNSKKGSIVQTAIIAATMAVKNTFNTIPLCHQIPISSCKFQIDPDDNGFAISCTVKTNSQTGVEMEALTAASVAALTLYDMCKAVDKGMSFELKESKPKKEVEKKAAVLASHF